jgi:hypothetical protein
LVKVYLFIRKAIYRLSYYVEVLINSFFLGIFTKNQFKTLDEYYYKECESEYKSIKYVENGLFDWEEKAVKDYFNKESKVLVIAAGTGRESFGLKKQGFKTLSFECNHDLREWGNKHIFKGPEIKSLLRNEFPNTEESLCGAVIGWGSYMLMMGRKNRVFLLKQLAEKLEQGSPVLLSFFLRNPKSFKHHLICLIASFFRVCTLRAPVDVGDELCYEYVHRFTQTELEKELDDAGFELVKFVEAPYPHAVAIKRSGEWLVI